jgi:hypothetical protein
VSLADQRVADHLTWRAAPCCCGLMVVLAGLGLDSLIEIGASIVVIRESSGTSGTTSGAGCG